jgi:transposase
MVGELRQLDRRIAKAACDIESAVSASDTGLTALHGIGAVSAAKIISRVGSIHRFRSAAAFATYTGTAPIEVSSGDVIRHRLSRAGDRQLNSWLHVMALTQIRSDTPGRAPTIANDPKAKVSAKPCAASTGDSPMLSIVN